MKLKLIAGMSILLILALSSCASKEEKTLKFFNKGQALYEEGDYVKAQLEFKNALQIDPKYADAYFMLGKTALTENEFRQAFSAFKKTIELNPDQIDAQLELGKLFMAAKQLDKAQEKLDIVMAVQPDNPEALQLKAAVLGNEQNYAAAQEILEKLISDGYDEQEIYFGLFQIHRMKKDSASAERTLQDGVSANPDTVLLRNLLAQQYLNDGRIDDAIDLLKAIIEVRPDSAAFKVNLARVYWDNGENAKAVDVLDQMVSADPENEEMWLGNIRFYLAQKDLDSAEKKTKAGLVQISDSYRLRFVLSDIFLNREKPDEAIAVLAECLALDEDAGNPGIIEAKNRLARIYFARREMDIAEKYVDQVLDENPKSVDAHFTKGDIYLSRRDGFNAVTEFRTVVKEKPEMLTAHLRLAQAHVISQELELAEDTLQKALEVRPNSREVLTGLARVAAMKKDLEGAEEYIRKVLAPNPDDLQTRMNLGDLLLAKENYAGAEAEYRQLIGKAPQNPLGYIRLSRLYGKQGNWPKAIGTLEGGYRDNPNSAPLFSALVQVHMARKQPDQAIELCVERLVKNEKEAFTLNLAGQVYASQQNMELARESFEKAIQIQPMWQAPHNNLVRLYLTQGEKQEALQRLESALEANPKNDAAYLTLGLLHQRSREFDKARQVYQKGIGQNPSLWVAANNLAYLMAEYPDSADDLEQALQFAQKAEQMQPDRPAVLDTIGWIYYKKEDFVQAEDYIEQALVNAPESAVLNYHMGMVLFKSNRHAEARDKLEVALQSDEDFLGREEAEETLAKIESSS